MDLLIEREERGYCSGADEINFGRNQLLDKLEKDVDATLMTLKYDLLIF